MRYVRMYLKGLFYTIATVLLCCLVTMPIMAVVYLILSGYWYISAIILILLVAIPVSFTAADDDYPVY